MISSIRNVFAMLVLSFIIVGCSGDGSNQAVLNAKDAVVLITSEEQVDGQAQAGLGTGFFIGENKILTNNHVVGDKQHVKVRLENGSAFFDGEVVLADPIADMAIVKIKDWDKFTKENEYKVLTLADPNDLTLTEEIYTIGHPWALTWSVSKGILSAIDRKMDPSPKTMIQVDAHVYQGNSGGPLLNNKGEVLGINSMMISRDGGSYGLALPVYMINRVMRDWEKYKEVRWAQLGITIDGNEIKSVVSGSAAEKAGIKAGDKILSFTTSEGTYSPLNKSIAVAMAVHDSGQPVRLHIDRQGKDVDLEVKPTWSTSDQLVQAGMG